MRKCSVTIRALPRVCSCLALSLALALVAVGCTGSSPEPGSAAGATASLPPPVATFPTPLATLSPPPQPLQTGQPTQFSGANARRHVEELAGAIGSRPPGTEQERKAAAYIARQLADAGYLVEHQSFEFSSIEDQSSARLLDGAASVVPASLIARSAQGTVRGTLADAGLGIGLAPESLTGQVALLERGQITFEEKASRAAQAGATAALIFNNRPGLFQGAMQNPSPIPALAVSREDGLRLREALAARSVEVEVQAQAQQVAHQSQNVVARAASGCALVIGGHYDSVPEGPGANDNASGTAVMLEAARALAPVAMSRNLCFTAFGAEEVGLFGSRAFVERLGPEQRQAMTAMINLDMVGVGDRWRLFGDPTLASAAGQAARRVGVEVEARTLPRGTGSDHQSFLNAGIKAVFLHRTDDPRYHTPEDTAQWVDPANLEAAGKLTVALVHDLTGGP